MKVKLFFLTTLLILSSCSMITCSRRVDSPQKIEEIGYRNQARHVGRRAAREERNELRHKDREQKEKGKR